MDSYNGLTAAQFIATYIDPYKAELSSVKIGQLLAGYDDASLYAFYQSYSYGSTAYNDMQSAVSYMRSLDPNMTEYDWLVSWVNKIFSGSGSGGKANSTETGTTGADTLGLINPGAPTKMTGGTGDDIYIIDNKGDKVFERAGEGIDTVKVGLNAFSLAKLPEVENMTFTGTIAVKGTGNNANNTIVSGSGIDFLDGGRGNDTLDAGGGNNTINGGDGLLDTLLLAGSLSDYTFSVAQGKITSKAKYAPTGLNAGEIILVTDKNGQVNKFAGIEQLKFKDNINAQPTPIDADLLHNVPTYKDDTFTYTSSNETINGGLGNDSLTGNGGNDTFLFDSKLDKKKNVDTITDFNAGDRINLSKDIFAAYKTNAGANLSADFVTDTKPLDKTDHFIYDTVTGNLSYDADGSGSKAAVLFVTLTGHPALVASDLHIV